MTPKLEFGGNQVKISSCDDFLITEIFLGGLPGARKTKEVDSLHIIYTAWGQTSMCHVALVLILNSILRGILHDLSPTEQACMAGIKATCIQ